MTTDGTLSVSDPIEATHEEIEASGMVDMFKEFKSLGYLSIEVDGVVRYFNPANVVWAEIYESR
jgi:hypothetical protein